MKKHVIVVMFCCFYLISYGQKDSLNQTTTPLFKPEKYYTTKDPVLLASFEDDIVYVSKDDFNDVVRKHPEFFVESPTDPERTYAENSDEQFTSEVGQDDYYLFYAYFLRNTNEMYKIDNDFSYQRNKIMIIYTRLNRMFSLLDGGGPGYMHLYRRTFGEAEYTIYLYALTRNYFTVKYDITKQKNLFIQTLKQVVDDRLGNTFDILETEKPKLKKKINALINEIDSEITDSFFLAQAQRFCFNNYATW